VLCISKRAHAPRVLPAGGRSAGCVTIKAKTLFHESGKQGFFGVKPLKRAHQPRRLPAACLPKAWKAGLRSGLVTKKGKVLSLHRAKKGFFVCNLYLFSVLYANNISKQ